MAVVCNASVSYQLSQLDPSSNPKKANQGQAVSAARRAAFAILRRIEQEDAYSTNLLAATGDELRPDDRALCHELVLGVLRRRLWLDRVIQHLADRKIDDLDLAVLLALRLGIYQLRFLSRVPPSAAVNESVNLVRAGGVRSAAGLVNAVLRRATRELDYDPAAEVVDADEKLAVETSHPAWLIRRWANAFGIETATAFAHANNEPPPLAFRLTTKVLERTEGPNQVIQQLESAGARLTPSRLVPHSWRVDGVAGVAHELAREGLIYFQDEASQLVAHLLGAQPNEHVLDLCAAPGGKTLLTDALAPQALIVAGDLHEHRLRTLSALARLQGVTGVQPVVFDATQDLPFGCDSFDRVLVDAPCSGTGTLRRNPEIRWRLTLDVIKELAAKQTKILAKAATVVRPGGQLVYSTCSVEPEENEGVVETFLGTHQDFATGMLDVPAEMQTGTGAVRTWPHRDGVDGFFIKAFERRR